MNRILNRVLNSLKYRTTFFYYRMKFIIFQNTIKVFKVKSIEETIECIIQRKESVTRLGEGAFRWILGEQYKSFQSNSDNMRIRLKELLDVDANNCLLCITPSIGKYHKLGTGSEKKYWEYILGKEGKQWGKLLNKEREYYNANFTRIYMSDRSEKKAEEYLTQIKKIWLNREVLIVEGAYTRFGVGNNLLTETRLVERIICPSENAFEKYEKIFQMVLDRAGNKLVLLALGPTASILAYDLARQNIQAIDIGHLDVEYEWLRMKAKTKVPVKGRYVNEAGGFETFEELDDSVLDIYTGQIICSIC